MIAHLVLADQLLLRAADALAAGARGHVESGLTDRERQDAYEAAWELLWQARQQLAVPIGRLAPTYSPDVRLDAAEERWGLADLSALSHTGGG